MTTIEFEEEICCVCAIPFQVTKEFQELRENDHRFFFCPNGHEIQYCKSEEEIENSKLRAKNRELLCEIVRLKANKVSWIKKIKSYFK